MDALRTLQPAIDTGGVTLRQCEIHKDLWLTVDQAGDRIRMTYISLNGRQAQAIVMLVQAEPVEDVPCFQLGYAVFEHLRGQGLGTRTVAKALDEMKNGFSRGRMKRFYIEAVVSITNDPSNRLARRLLSDSPVSIIDSISGEPALQYLRLIQ
jgi:hypothetical protein